jgi:hypothetical protein
MIREGLFWVPGWPGNLWGVGSGKVPSRLGIFKTSRYGGVKKRIDQPVVLKKYFYHETFWWNHIKTSFI